MTTKEERKPKKLPEKQEKNRVKKLIDVRTITEDGIDWQMQADEQERNEIAMRFEVPKIISLRAEGRLTRGDMIALDGVIYAEAERICVATMKPFVEKTETPIHLLFSEKIDEQISDDPEDETILPIIRGKIDLTETIAEEFGLTLNPFPKSISGYCDYHDPEDNDAKESPFAVLKKLKKEK